MNILDETAAALPEVSERLRDFLAPRMGQPDGEAASAPVPAAAEAEAAEAESGTEDEGPEPAQDAVHEPHPDGEPTPRELAAGYSLDTERQPARQIGCPVCQAGPGEPCLNTVTGEPGSFIHGGRVATWENRPAPTAEADASALAEHPLDGAQ